MDETLIDSQTDFQTGENSLEPPLSSELQTEENVLENQEDEIFQETEETENINQEDISLSVTEFETLLLQQNEEMLQLTRENSECLFLIVSCMILVLIAFVVRFVYRVLYDFLF